MQFFSRYGTFPSNTLPGQSRIERLFHASKTHYLFVYFGRTFSLFKNGMTLLTQV